MWGLLLWTAMARRASRPIYLPLSRKRNSPSEPRNNIPRFDEHVVPIAALFGHHAFAAWRERLVALAESGPACVVKNFQRPDATARRQPGHGSGRADHHVNRRQHGGGAVQLIL